MDNKKKKDLAKIALAAFMLSASLPAAVNASTDVETNGTLLAGGGCAAASTGNRPASGSCGASSGRYSPSTSGCGASQGRYSPATSGCGASQGRYAPATSGCGASQRTSNNAPATHGCGAATGEETPPPPSPKNSKPNVRPNPVAMGNQTPSAGNMGNMDDSGNSSYQGTTTGPGPNDGYPGTPKGSYNVNQKPAGR